ncbi:MAG: 50S ribosomal protein L21, partial [Candidatus Omnitrophica bacterium]|nr:50S ribosomal protein L21 [Candidatus Omnitrophota bacterium]
MYAIIEVGAKQYNVKKDDVIDVERQTAQEGKEITLKKVLLVSEDKDSQAGQPHVKEATVKGVVLANLRGKKGGSFKCR